VEELGGDGEGEGFREVELFDDATVMEIHELYEGTPNDASFASSSSKETVVSDADMLPSCRGSWQLLPSRADPELAHGLSSSSLLLVLRCKRSSPNSR